MLRQIFIIKNNNIIFERQYGNALTKPTLLALFAELQKQALSALGKEIDHTLYFKYRLSYTLINRENKIFIIFTTGLSLTDNIVEKELRKFKNEFLDYFGEILSKLDPSMFNILDPVLDSIHRNLRPKISLIGFAGVGKTTITQLIKAEEIPMEHVPTITGDRATIKIGKLEFNLWDFAGQEQFSYLWGNFMKGSDAILLITDSSIENVEKSKFFIELIKNEAPYAHSAVIGNKQDLPTALPINKIDAILGLKTYSMIAVDPDNRSKMIQIIADILEMNSDLSPLLKPMKLRDELMAQAECAIEQTDFNSALEIFDKLNGLCLEMGDDSLAREFYDKAEKLKTILKS